MRDWAFAIMIGLIIISISSCVATVAVSDNKTKVELEKLRFEQTK